MRTLLPCVALLASAVTGFGANPPAASPEKSTPLFLAANAMSIATGKPSLVLMSNGSTHIPVWSLSGGTAGQSVVGVVALPGGCAAVQVEIVVTTTEAPANPGCEDVYRVHLSQLAENAPFTQRSYLGNPVRTALPPAPFHSRTIVLESYSEVLPDAPLCVRIQREPTDPADTFPRPTGLAMVKLTPVKPPAKPHVVQEARRYNSWPMIQAIGDKLVCVYSRGSAHSIGEDARAVYARTSADKGQTWTEETLVADTSGFGEVAVGKGLDSTGAMLLWVRRVGAEWLQDLYRTADGATFQLVATPKLAVMPVQITDVFTVPKVGLTALWFAGDYGDGTEHSWGTLISADDGATWKQTVIESGLSRSQWPTEPSAVYLGDGRILAIGRSEIWGGSSTVRSQFQLTSTDYGATWKRAQTNIGEVVGSTPSLILDPKTGLVSNYYYQRGRGGVLRRRVVDPALVFDNPLTWPASAAVATGSELPLDAGNVNATAIGDTHFLAFYSGKAPDTAILVSAVPAPSNGNSPSGPPASQVELGRQRRPSSARRCRGGVSSSSGIGTR